MAIVLKRPKRAPDVTDPHERELIEALNGRFDQINHLWAEAEQKLKRFAIPVDVQVTMRAYSSRPEEPDYPVEIRHCLGFAKCAGGWRICHSIEHDDYPQDDGQWKALSECSLDVRLEAIPYLPALKAKVVKAAENSIGTLDSGIAELRKAVDGI